MVPKSSKTFRHLVWPAYLLVKVVNQCMYFELKTV